MATPTLKQIEAMVVDATGEYVNSEDWAAFIAITDIVNDSRADVKGICKILQKRISKVKDSKSQLLSLSLLETVVKNCEKTHVFVGSSDFQSMLLKLALGKKTASSVRDKIVSLVQVWNHAFQRFDSKRYKYCHTYDQMLRKGVSFPVFAVEDQPPLFTPPPIQQALEELQNEDLALAASMSGAGPDGGWQDYDESGSFSYSGDEEEEDEESRYYRQQQQQAGVSAPPHQRSHHSPIIYESLPPNMSAAGVQPAYPAGSPQARAMLQQQVSSQQRILQQQYEAQQRQQAAQQQQQQQSAPARVDVEQSANAAELLRDMLVNVDLDESADGTLAPDELTDGLMTGLRRALPGLQQQIAMSMADESGSPTAADRLARLLVVNDQAMEALAMYDKLKKGEKLSAAERRQNQPASDKAKEPAGAAPSSSSSSSAASSTQVQSKKKKKSSKKKEKAAPAASSTRDSVDLLGLGDLSVASDSPPAAAASAASPSASSSDWLNDAFGSTPQRMAPSPRDQSSAPGSSPSNPFLSSANPFSDLADDGSTAVQHQQPTAPPMTSSADDFDSFFSSRA